MALSTHSFDHGVLYLLYPSHQNGSVRSPDLCQGSRLSGIQHSLSTSTFFVNEKDKGTKESYIRDLPHLSPSFSSAERRRVLSIVLIALFLIYAHKGMCISGFKRPANRSGTLGHLDGFLQHCNLHHAGDVSYSCFIFRLAIVPKDTLG